MVSVPRNDKIFNAIAARSGLTRCGTQWCRQALDPFHDSFLKDPCGYPDTNGDASIVQVVKQSYNIAAPITSGNWDCNVVMMPWVNPIVMTASTNNGANGATPLNYLTQANPSTSGDITVGGIQVISAASGTACDITEPSVAATYSNTSNTIPATYLAGNGRVVAMAMEIVNTTSELNKQGLVTMYRIPVPQNDDCPTMYLNNNAASGDTVTYNGAASVVYVPAPQSQLLARSCLRVRVLGMPLVVLTTLQCLTLRMFQRAGSTSRSLQYTRQHRRMRKCFLRTCRGRRLIRRRQMGVHWSLQSRGQR